MQLQTIILAAGQGTRMRSATPKVLHKIGGTPLLEHVYRLARQLGGQEINVVYGHGGEQVLSALSDLQVRWTEQTERLGTGHAVMQVADRISDANKVLILYGDVPLLRLKTVQKLIQHVGPQSLGLLTIRLDNPSGYGRIVRDSQGKVVRIVEEKDASNEQRAIGEVNTGILAVPGAKLKEWLGRLNNDNAQGEYYLTDIIALAVEDGFYVDTTQPDEESEVLGINNRAQLAQLERLYQLRHAEDLMDKGVTLRDPARFDLRGDIEALGQDVEIDVNVVLQGRIRLGNRVKIGPNVLISDSEIGDGVEILANSVIENAQIGAGGRIGPFARIRPESVLAEDVHIGNFVEIKKTTVGQGSKINHLSYVGDARVGAGVNIGAGTITCNYDGANKHLTVIEDGAFIGSDTQLVAPVTVGRNATLGAGTTLTKDAPADTLTLSRAKQASISGWQRPVKKRT
ncbi:bifunctional UDP-N-acetylglucosamine diphosphorylase/glucosamine-1-phosphate N-acetyltransferase GlmU [Methylococcus sp. EFPC2]|uniref:bifunctional UDP-N-acetylglucosamine diphosphorylase/glucosamine-1-phosphate N-acetyltransferase GlmU n=1 Tax=Methylococcus sp. EFPC2 TaxID=2812648 RepID=UPI0019675957|nr:bifunctional UDP-N-acetylglucosamine diphosphorylase/glucosamine-1-phosphate N-acetyltransferase GlmU [Methylococcus sp. EFPC2]QSA96076.1 bifunctional UDP-N-acetylglucosamine diphosphorylase/glucosamine-1-phosphate N-acetyltransferase GlmU [Methylococcus sp. EFPC2]